MIPAVRKSFERIRKLKIQGAWNVALESVKALDLEMQASNAKTREEFLKQMQAAILFLRASRPTEPALRNALRFVFSKARKSKEQGVEKLKELVENEARNYAFQSMETKKKIAEFGCRLVESDSSVLIHCHSSTIMQVLKKAKDERKKFRVYCTETRPLYQGRISARELSDYGIKTTLIVDSAANYLLSTVNDLDLVLVGADAITSSGDLVNKIGTSQLALSAFEHGKKLYSCTGTHKFDPLTLWGVPEPIEQRAKEELLSNAERKLLKLKNPKNLSVLNPAFDLTPAKYITGYVTEIGILPPQGFTAAVWKEFDLDKGELFDFYKR
ncbi:S-methyl-5-thioribose-1-phosphate isomerase [Candidatus Micrarchaeota archaeon]|nr:S-methyl-5-thioribose-1-phosphate isomerase [Candidatus Micrarchaeota archaeon]